MALTLHSLPPFSFSSSFISFIFLLLVPQALITSPSRLTAGWNWNWQIRVMVAEHWELTVREERRRKQMSHLSLCYWSSYFKCGSDWVGFEVVLFQRGSRAWLGLQIGFGLQLKPPKFYLHLKKACGVPKTPLNFLIIFFPPACFHFHRQNHSSQTWNLSVTVFLFFGHEYKILLWAQHCPWCVLTTKGNPRAVLKQQHFIWG